MQPGKTRLVMLESPTNPRMGICDLKALCAIARKVIVASWLQHHGIRTGSLSAPRST